MIVHRRLAVAVSAGAALVGTLGTALGALASPREAAFSWLFAFVFWLSLCLGALIALQMLHASRSRWVVVCRRPLEVLAGSLPLFVVLFLPLIWAAPLLYPWLDPPAQWSQHQLEVFHHKTPYLNFSLFLVRAGVYLVLWGTVGVLLYRWSAAQDALAPQSPRSLRLTSWQRKLAAGALPLVVVGQSFASTDWTMSLEPLWHSTVYGLYAGCGAVVGGLCVLLLWGAMAQAQGQVGAAMKPEHWRRLGTLTLTFVCLWAYCGFSQYLLIWQATLPEEVTWYLSRGKGSWRAAAWLLMIGNFALPFLLLLLRAVKERPRLIGPLAAWLLAMHALDIYWLVVPALRPHELHLHWTAPLAWFGCGGACLLTWLFLQGRVRAIPAGDPFLPHSLEVPRS
jgi:hypothetical protein